MHFESKIIRKIKFPFQFENKLIISPNGDYLISGRNWHLYCFDTKNKRLDSIPFEAPIVYCGDCSKTGKIIVPEYSLGEDAIHLSILSLDLKLIRRVGIPKSK